MVIEVTIREIFVIINDEIVDNLFKLLYLYYKIKFCMWPRSGNLLKKIDGAYEVPNPLNVVLK